MDFPSNRWSSVQTSRLPYRFPLLNRNWLSWMPDGDLLMIQGGGREAWNQKQLVRCSVTTGDCQPLPQPETVVTLDPATAPDGSRIAVVRAESRPTGNHTEAENDAWQTTRRLWVANPDGSGAGHAACGQLPALTYNRGLSFLPLVGATSVVTERGLLLLT